MPLSRGNLQPSKKGKTEVSAVGLEIFWKAAFFNKKIVLFFFNHAAGDTCRNVNG